jgi:nitrate reductase gamma subunit
MSALTVLYGVLLCAAAALLAAGTLRKIVQYSRTPAPLRIPTMPAPTTRLGVVLRMAREVVLFESLFRANKWTWVFGILFHAAMLVVVLGHLRYFTQPVWGWVVLLRPFGAYAGLAMLAGLGGLWLRRLLVDRVRYISGASDHLMLLLLGAVALSGLTMRYLLHTDIVALKAFALGLLRLDWQPLPADPALLIHLALVALLMAVFPFSKLLHAPGVFFQPTRYQVDNSREVRHVGSWTAALERQPDA